MQNTFVTRSQTVAECAELQRMLANVPSTTERWRQGAENFLILWAVSLLGVAAVWLIAAWLGRQITGVEFGLQSSAAVWVLGVAAPICCIYASISTWRWFSGWRDYRPSVDAEIKAAVVQEETLYFQGAIRFQEIEHGGLIYFFRTYDEQVFTFYDHESQDLGVEERDPLLSTFVPMSKLVLVRAPHSGLVLTCSFSGVRIDPGEPIPLGISPENWPEHQEFCAIPWLSLPSQLGSSSSAFKV